MAIRRLDTSAIGCFFGTLLAFAAQAAPFAYIPNTDSKSVSVIDLTTNAVVGLPIPVGDTPRSVAVNPAGTRVYVTNEFSNDVSVIDTATNTVVGAPIRVGTSPWGIAVNSAGTRAYVANANGHSVSVIDTATNAVVATIDTGPQYFSVPTGIVLNPAGTRAYVTSSTTLIGGVTVIDILNNTVLGDPISTGSSPVGIAINPAGTRAYVANEVSGNVSVIDTARSVEIGSIDTEGRATGIAIHPQGNRLYVGGQDVVLVIDTATNLVVGRNSAPSVGRSIGINAAGTRLLVATLDGKVLVIDTATNATIATVSVPGQHDFVGQFFIGPDILGPGGTPKVVEFYHEGFDHYFLTPVEAEIALLDARVPPFQEWSRTGYTFNAYAPATAPPGSVSVCRFFNDHFAPKSSHFYAPHGFGCEATLSQFPDWGLEDSALFNTTLPDAAGNCPVGSIPLYRLYNQGMGNAPNHRFVTSFTEQQTMINQGWTAEGAGIGVAMCAPL